MQTRVRAVIIQDNKVLLIRRTKPDQPVYWVIPGGGVEQGETDEQAIQRECREELGVDVRVKELILEMDSKKPETGGMIEHFYLCEITKGKLGTGNGPEFATDTSYVGNYNLEWHAIENLNDINLKPEDIKRLLCVKFNKQRR